MLRPRSFSLAMRSAKKGAKARGKYRERRIEEKESIKRDRGGRRREGEKEREKEKDEEGKDNEEGART